MDDDAFGFWYRDCIDGKWEDGYWYYNYEPADDSVTFNAGEGFWFTSLSAPKDDSGNPTATYKFVNSGAVDQNDRNYKLRDAGNLVGNPMPATVNLSDLTITGYENNEEVKTRGGLINLEFSFALLDFGGFTMDDDAFGFWYEDYTDDAWQGGYWYYNYEPVVPGEVDLELPPGQAMWLTAMSAPKDEDEKPLETYYLQFPTPVPAAAK